MFLHRRKRKTYNIRPPSHYRSQTYRQWVAGWPCILEGKAGHVCVGRVVCAHLRIGTDGNKKDKPSDWWGLPMCDDGFTGGAHGEQHRIGEPAFYKLHGIIDPHTIPAKLWWHSKNSHRFKHEQDPDATTASPPERAWEHKQMTAAS